MTGRVLVSGAAGFVGAHVVEQLLAGGWSVRATMRDPAKGGHLTALPGAAGRLELVAADLLDDRPFHAAAQGCDHAIHAASPYALSSKDPQRFLVDPAVRGTLAMLEACAAAPSVRRVVVTSSMAAVTDEPDGRVLTEADWNETSSLTRNPYYFSKVMAERAAWAFMEERRPGFGLVAINPFLVIGPAHTAVLNPSNKVLADLATGAYPAIMALTWGIVDVRDVAKAHVLALTAPQAAGRYLCAAGTRSMPEVAELIRTSPWNTGKVPKRRLDNPLGTALGKLASHMQPPGVGAYLRKHLGRTPRFDCGKIGRDLGLTFRDVDASLRDALADLAKWGHIGGRAD